MKAKILRIVAVVAVLVTVAVVLVRRAQAANPNVVVGSGTVEAIEIGVASQATGRLSALLVDESDQVTKGQVVARLEQVALQGDLDHAHAAADSARWRLADLARDDRKEDIRAKGAAVQEAVKTLQGARLLAATARAAKDRPPDLVASADSAQAQLQAAGHAVEQARAALDEARHGPRPQEIASARAFRAASGSATMGAQTALEQARSGVSAAQAALADADAAVAGADKDVVEAKRALEERTAASTQVASAQTQLDTAREALAAARAHGETVNAVPRPDKREEITQQIAAATANVTFAESELARQQQLFESGAISRHTLELTQTGVASARASLRMAQAALKDLDAGSRISERSEAGADVRRNEAAVAGAETALANARHEQEIQLSTARQAADRADTAATQARERRKEAAAALDQARDKEAQEVAAVEQFTHQSGQAQAELDLALAGTRAERIAAAEAAVRVAEAQQGGAAQSLIDAKRALADRFNYRQQLQAADQQAAVAKAKVDEAQAVLDLALAGNTTQAINAARGDLDQAKAAEVTAQANFDYTEIRAPATGAISEVILRQGEECTPGSVVVRMLDLAHQWVRIYLPVPAMTRIVRGQEADVLADAMPGKPFPGHVMAISDQAEFTPKNAQTVEERVKQVFWVKIDIGDGGGRLKPGIPVDVRIAVLPRSGTPK
jgi:multidrug resistance efflux pump